jgi:hypothetical protein
MTNVGCYCSIKSTGLAQWFDEAQARTVIRGLLRPIFRTGKGANVAGLSSLCGPASPTRTLDV